MRASAAVNARVLARLAAPGAILAPEREGGHFALYAAGDRRRRPLARLTESAVAALERDGALEAVDRSGVRVLSAAGRAWAARARAAPEEAWRAQHGPIEARAVIDAAGAMRPARGVLPGGEMARLARLTDGEGGRFFAPEEIAAGARLRADWDQGQQGMLHGSNWTAPPRGNAPRGAGGGLEHAAARVIDARRRFDAAIAALAPAAAEIVRAVCLGEQGLEGVERGARWPARSGKVALKLGLAQLALHYRAR